MCLLSPKVEEEYTVPARVTRTRRVSRVSRRSPSPPRSVRVRQSIIEERRPSPEPVLVPPPPPPSIPPPPASIAMRSERRTSRAPSRTQTHFVEVDHDTSSSSSSSEEDVRSRTTSHTRKSSRSKVTAPQSEYSLHEREYRRERDYGSPKPEYETYRYVEAPQERRSGSRGPRNSFYDGPRASRDSYRRERMVVEDDHGRRRREYQR